jgi:hypothetical protein
MQRCAPLLYLVTLLSCTEKTAQQHPTAPGDSTSTRVENSLYTPPELFADVNFPFLSIDSLSEQRLGDPDQDSTKFSSWQQKFTLAHCRFFKIGCTNSFFDRYTFLVSKQQPVGDILPVIVHNSSDFNYYHSDLITLDKNYNKVDSITVSLEGFDGGEDYSTQKQAWSRFVNDQIITTTLTRRIFDNDSSVVLDSTISHLRIAKSGTIVVENVVKLK